MEKTIVEKIYPKETFIHKFEELGFTFEDYGWSGDDDEYGMQDYFFSFSFVNFEDEVETDGELKVIIEIDDKKVYFDMRVNHGCISEKSRIGMSKVIHELAKRTPKDMERITFHGCLIKDMAFYEETVNGLNKEKLLEIAKGIQFRKTSSFGTLPIRGLEGQIFAEVLIDIYKASKIAPFGENFEYNTHLMFKGKREITTVSEVHISKYFSTNY